MDRIVTPSPLRVPRGRRSLAAVGISLGIVGLLIASTNGLAVYRAAPVASGKLALFDQKVDHIVYLVQENHAFDNFYGTYCQTTGKYCSSVANGLPAGTCVPINPAVRNGPCVKPYNFTAAQLTIHDLPHDWYSTHAAYNGGAMNNFWAHEGMNNNTFGHYNGTTIPVEWDLAEQYGLGDNFYSSAASFSLPNHWFTVAASAPLKSYNDTFQSPGVPTKDYFTYLNEANQTPALEDELNHSKTTWGVYDYSLYGYNASTKPNTTSPGYSYWNPLGAREQSYKQKNKAHFLPRGQFFNDSANGTLPNVSWLIPSVPDSEHPSTNESTGESWIASVVDALERSPEWNSTVLFVTWDEYGGFYDHVAPPGLDAYGDGFRVPLLAIGPYVTQGIIDHDQMDFDSVLHLIEERFHLKCLGTRDCNALTPINMFAFGKGPRAPVYFAPYGTAVYPMPLQSSGKLPPYGGTAPVTLPPTALGFNAAALPNVDWS